MKLETRIKIENRIARATVDGLLAAGFLVAVDNGGDSYEVGPTSNRSALFSALGHTDEEHLFAYEPAEPGKSPRRAGWVFLVYGESGYDLINNHTTNLEPALAKANALADNLEELFG